MMRIGKKKLRSRLDRLYDSYNKRAFVDPDPLLFLYDYPDKLDREVVGMVASCLAYGRVKMIMKTVGEVLDKMGPSPADFAMSARPDALEKVFDGFVYRFAKQAHLTALIMGIQGVINTYGSLEACFAGDRTSAGQEGGWAASTGSCPPETAVPEPWATCWQIPGKLRPASEAICF